MTKNYHYSIHIYTLILYLLAPPIINVYMAPLLGALRMVVCALVGIGILVYRYYVWGYNLSVRDRSSFREFLIGMLPAQAIHILFYLFIYLVFAFLYSRFRYGVFEVLRLGNVAIATFVMGMVFLWIGYQTFSIDITSFGYMMTVLSVSVIVYIVVSCIAYGRGVNAKKKMLQGIQKKNPEPFAKRFRFVPFVNLLSVFPFLYRHFFGIEYKIRPAVFLLVFLFVARLLYNGMCVYLWSLVPSFYFYYSLKVLGVYLLGLIVSTVELRDKK